MLERARKYALNSSVMQELKEEYLDTPTEITNTNSFKQRVNKYQKHRQE
jgi:U3 small nucleolar ribonucleoprotein protein LCP5